MTSDPIPMTVADLKEVLVDIPDEATVQIHDGYYGIDSDVKEWVFIMDGTRTRFVLGRGDR